MCGGGYLQSSVGQQSLTKVKKSFREREVNLFSMDLPITTPIGDALNRGALKKLEKRKNKIMNVCVLYYSKNRSWFWVPISKKSL